MKLEELRSILELLRARMRIAAEAHLDQRDQLAVQAAVDAVNAFSDLDGRVMVVTGMQPEHTVMTSTLDTVNTVFFSEADPAKVC